MDDPALKASGLLWIYEWPISPVPGPDIGQWLVSNGRALDWPQYSKGKYELAQQGAEKAARGIWSGSFVEPRRYCACRRLGTTINQCSDGD